jgi:hypothetical protein
VCSVVCPDHPAASTRKPVWNLENEEMSNGRMTRVHLLTVVMAIAGVIPVASALEPPYTSLAWSSDGRAVLATHRDGKLTTWRPNHASPKVVESHIHLAVSRDGRWLAVQRGRKGAIETLRLPSRERGSSLQLSPDAVENFRVKPGLQTLVVAPDDEEPSFLVVHVVGIDGRRRAVRADPMPLFAAPSPDGRHALVEMELGDLEVWRLDERRVVRRGLTLPESIRLAERVVSDLFVTRDSRTALVLHGRREMQLAPFGGWEILEVDLQRARVVRNAQLSASAVALDLDAKRELLATGNFSSVSIIDWKSLAELHRLDTAGCAAHFVSWSPDGERLAVALFNGALEVFTKAGRKVASHPSSAAPCVRDSRRSSPPPEDR